MLSQFSLFFSFHLKAPLARKKCPLHTGDEGAVVVVLSERRSLPQRRPLKSSQLLSELRLIVAGHVVAVVVKRMCSEVAAVVEDVVAVVIQPTHIPPILTQGRPPRFSLQ